MPKRGRLVILPTPNPALQITFKKTTLNFRLDSWMIGCNPEWVFMGKRTLLLPTKPLDLMKVAFSSVESLSLGDRQLIEVNIGAVICLSSLQITQSTKDQGT